MNDNDPEFSEDLLRGAREIAVFLYGRSDDKTRRKIFHLVKNSNFPSFKIGSMICARRSRVRFAPTMKTRAFMNIKFEAGRG